jgi:sulfate adenylyltransferase subunit 1
MNMLAELERNHVADLGVLRFITAGSVDDGKSTLIGRLLHDTRAILQDQLAAVTRASSRRGSGELDLSLLTDGLEAEREQGITIDVAYRYFATARRKFIIADTPGHEQYTRNMVTAASNADAAVILVDASKGLLPQSRRHLLLAHLLGIRHIIVAVNKLDLSGYEYVVFKSIRDAIARFAAPLKIPHLSFIPVSALKGDMVVERGDHIEWYEGPTLLEALENIAPANIDAELPLRFPVQYVGRGNGVRRYQGRVAGGVLRAGDELVALPGKQRVRVAAVYRPGGLQSNAIAGDSVALELSADLDVSRGDMLVAAARPPRTTRKLEATLCWLGDEPLATLGRYLLKHTSRTVKARFASIHYEIDIDTLRPRPSQHLIRMNDIFHAELDLQQPVFADSYTANRVTGAFILVDEVTNQTIAAGMIA